jgi:hypothetical protein
VDGTQNRGIIAFEPLDLERTRITLTMEYEPEGLLERAGDALGIPSSQVEGDLKRFRDFIERRERENGGWDGQRVEDDLSGSLGASSTGERPTEVKNGDRTLGHKARYTSPLSTDTEEFFLTTDDEGTLRMKPEDDRLPVSTEPETEFFPDSTPIAPVRAVAENHSKFYRDGEVLAPTHQQIAQRAYELYVARGRVDGYAREDWLEAERQLSVSK